MGEQVAVLILPARGTLTTAPGSAASDPELFRRYPVKEGFEAAFVPRPEAGRLYPAARAFPLA
jgi:hypothetical protein